MLRAIQIGVGGFGRSWLRTVAKEPDIELAALVDVRDKNLAEAANILQRGDIPVFRDHREAFREVQADAALIVTPPMTHASIAFDAMEAGLHIFMEKPLTYSLREAVVLYSRSLTYEKKTMINQNYRWTREIQAIKQAIDRRVAGEIAYVEWSFRRLHNANSGTWREHSPDFLFTDVSIHHFDLMRYFFEADPLLVNADSMRPAWSWCEGNLVGGATFDFPGGLKVYYTGSLAATGSETTWNGDIRIVGSEGAIELVNDIPMIVRKDKSIEHLPLPEMAYVSQAFSLHEFVNSVHNDTTPITGLQDNIRSFLMVYAAIESAKQKRRVAFGEYVDLLRTV